MLQKGIIMTQDEALKQRDAHHHAINEMYSRNHLFVPGMSEEENTFAKYFHSQFNSDLHRYYDVDCSCGNFKYPFVLEMTWPKFDADGLRFVGLNIDRIGLIWAGTRHFSMFAAGVFYMSAYAQILGKLYCRKAMETFHKLSGWPMLNCGMGGLMSPIQVMVESDLFPYSNEIDDYLDVFNEAAEYFESANTPEVRTELLKWRETFEAWVRDPRKEYDLYYLDPKEIWGD